MESDDAIRSVLEQLTPRLRVLLNRYQISHADGEDLLQEALLVTFSRWEEIDNKAGWLLITVRNLCSAYQRRRRCWSRLVQAVDDEAIQMLARTLPPPQDQVEIIEDIKKLFSRVAAVDRNVVYLKYCEDLGPTQLASRIDCHPASVRKMTLRALEHLRRAAVSSRVGLSKK